MSIGVMISKRRKELKMSQEALAEKMVVSRAAIAKWETSRGVPNRDNLVRLSACLDIPLEQLLEHSIEEYLK